VNRLTAPGQAQGVVRDFGGDVVSGAMPHVEHLAAAARQLLSQRRVALQSKNRQNRSRPYVPGMFLEQSPTVHAQTCSQARKAPYSAPQPRR